MSGFSPKSVLTPLFALVPESSGFYRKIVAAICWMLVVFSCRKRGYQFENELSLAVMTKAAGFKAARMVRRVRFCENRS